MSAPDPVLAHPVAIVESIELADGTIQTLGWPITRIDDYLDVAGCSCVLLRAEHGDREVPLLVEARRITVTRVSAGLPGLPAGLTQALVEIPQRVDDLQQRSGLRLSDGHSVEHTPAGGVGHEVNRNDSTGRFVKSA